MKFSLTISGFLLMVSSSQCVDITVKGKEGEQMTIKCPYDDGYENSNKYLYKGLFKDKNIILTSYGGESSVFNGRFSMRDDHQMRTFIVTIMNLSIDDAGPYGCRAGWGEYKQIQLNVIKAPQKKKPAQISTTTIHMYTNTSADHTSTENHQTESEITRTVTGSTAVHLVQSNTSLASVTGGLGSVLLVLILCSGMFLILKKKKRKSGTALFQQNVQHNETDRMYEEISNSHAVTAASSSNQTPASHLNTRPQVSTVYATVTNQQPDSNPCQTHSTNQHLEVLQKQSQDTQEKDLTSNAPMNLDMSPAQSIFVKARVFTVTITDLRTTDQGQYWCGVEGIIFDDYTEIFLKVTQDKKTTEVSTTSAFSNTPPQFSTTELNPQSTSITITNQHKSTVVLASVAGVLGSVPLVRILCFGTFLILKNKKMKSKTALFQQNVQHNMESVHMYEIANSDPGPSDVIAAESTSNQTPTSHLSTRPQVPTIYATQDSWKMFSKCVILLIFSSICTVVVGAPKSVTGHRGEQLDIRCPYDSGYESNAKYFCKGECNIGNKNIMVKSGSIAKDQRFSLIDNKTTRVFTVTITDLRTEDKGKYWCAVERTFIDWSLRDVYSEILLLVKRDNTTTEVSTISSFTTTPSYFNITEIHLQSTSITITERKETITDHHSTSTDLASVAGSLGSVLLVLILCSGAFLILKKRKRKSGTALFQQNMQHNAESDLMYEEIPNSHVITTSSSSNQTPQVSPVYSTVTNQQPDSNPCHTHSTNQMPTEEELEIIRLCTSVQLFFQVLKKTVTGHTGERLDIKCPYESGYESSSKYFCKGECNFGKKNKVVESGSSAKDKRFSLTDDTTARVFTVTITDLRTEDAGQYWCAVEGIIFDAYTEILLIVKQVVVGAAKTVPGHKGEQLDIRCPYKSGYESNAKYFCKGECKIGNKNIMVKSGSIAKDHRFSLTDNKTTRVFTVTITDLRSKDEGQYWCAVEGTVYDGYSEIMLLVKHDNKTTVSTISHFTTTPSYFNTTEANLQSTSIIITDHHSSSTGHLKVIKCAPGDVLHTGSVVYISVGLVIMLIIFLMALMVVCRKRIKKSPKVAQSGNSQQVSVVLLPLNANTAEDIDCNNHSYQEISELHGKGKGRGSLHVITSQHCQEPPKTHTESRTV
ncbi:hypothetical protein Q8A67_005278 [Cirrhinus molitorella]|uniref:Immunoglobulin domain-containing protein n=1 Tax=Cirrhinus molitorella TaxID=172907 RepID=A0AA88PZJ5_9TELE|nr:hypothetical protein Q8A67_005278 [Cirrhinus molitorella]